jgi:hypothetical protein
MAILSRGLGFVVASVTGLGGTGVVMDLGFIPSHAHGFDATSGDTQWWWNSGMNLATTSGGSLIEGFVATPSAFSTISRGAGGITSLDGSAGTGIGLTLGTNTTINVSAHGVLVTAWEPM